MKDQFIRFRDKTVGLGLIAMASSTLYFAVRNQNDNRDLKSLREQNRILSKQIEKLEDSFASVRNYTGSANALATPGLKPKPENPNSFAIDPLKAPLQDFFFRGVSLSAKSTDSDAPRINPRSDLDMFADLVTRVDNLNRDTDGIVGRLRGLASILKYNKNLMRTIPSMQPVEGRVTSNFGWRLSPFEGRRHMHAGIDIAAEKGEIVKAPADGVVTFVGNFESLGQTIVITHGNGVITRYGHLHRYMVRKGVMVKRGQSIAQVGNTGRSTGPHLHYEVWIRNVPVDPMDFFYDLAGSDETLASARSENQKNLALTGIGGER
jgi:murein DD-endopeptidase MepM/ murein hydrolase activator NlpD